MLMKRYLRKMWKMKDAEEIKREKMKTLDLIKNTCNFGKYIVFIYLHMYKPMYIHMNFEILYVLNKSTAYSFN